MPVELTRERARQIAVRAQLLDQPRPRSVLEVVRQLTLLQLDLTTAVAPSHHLVLWSRLGSAYLPGELDTLLDQRVLLELRMVIRPAEDLALYRAEMARWPGPEPQQEWERERVRWVEANDRGRRDILTALAEGGPLPTGDLPDTTAVPWRSSGWTNNRNLTQLLGLMVQRGEVAVAGRGSGQRLWDLAERVYPDDPVPPVDEAAALRAELRLASLGIARARGTELAAGEQTFARSAGVDAVVAGVKGRWRVDPDQLDRPFAGRVALLSPLDRLVYDRKRMLDLFEFDYQLEMYKPAAKRRWGYWALPILSGDRLVGKIDATAHRGAGVLRINRVHQDVAFDADLEVAVEAELENLAEWLGLRLELST